MVQYHHIFFHLKALITAKHSDTILIGPWVDKDGDISLKATRELLGFMKLHLILQPVKEVTFLFLNANDCLDAETFDYVRDVFNFDVFP